MTEDEKKKNAEFVDKMTNKFLLAVQELNHQSARIGLDLAGGRLTFPDAMLQVGFVITALNTALREMVDEVIKDENVMAQRPDPTSVEALRKAWQNN